MSTGLVLGKFLPPTCGHRYLIDFARHWVDDLTVILGSLEREPIPGSLRLAWLREMFPQPNVRVVHCTDENPQYPEEHRDFWNIWVRSVRRFLPTGPDFLFASEPYGHRFATELGATFIPVDLARELVPVSGTAVRADPLGHWHLLPEPVRLHYLKRVCIIGPESSGKSTLAAELARQFGTVQVHEYARGLIDAMGGTVTPDLFPRILAGQRAAEAAMAVRAEKVLICDTDAFTTALFHELYVGPPPPEYLDEARRRRYDLYLITDCDTPFVVDGQRHHQNRRTWFRDRCQAWATESDTPQVLLRGSWNKRQTTAIAAIEGLLRRSPA